MFPSFQSFPPHSSVSVSGCRERHERQWQSGSGTPKDSFEEVTDWSRSLGPGANVLDHPLGAWPVTEVTLLVTHDPEATHLDPEQFVEAINDFVGSEHDSLLVQVKNEERVGYILAPFAHPGGHGGPDYGPCDCGPEIREDWAEHVRPLVPSGLLVLLDRVRDQMRENSGLWRGDKLPIDTEGMTIALADAERSLGDT